MVAQVTDIDTVDIIPQPQQWTVTYRGDLICVCRRRLSKQPKYQRTVFATRKPAQNLADKLNQQFNTSEFTVMVITAVPEEIALVVEPTPRPRGRPPKADRVEKPMFQTRVSKVKKNSMRVTEAGHQIYTNKDTGVENIKLKITKKLV